MSETCQLKANDGHELDAYVSRPSGTPIAGLVVIQEAFGVNSHIRSVADGYARDGFLAIAPALFDRIERGVELGYDGDDCRKALRIARQIDHGRCGQRYGCGACLAARAESRQVRRDRLLLRRHDGVAGGDAPQSSPQPLAITAETSRALRRKSRAAR